MMNDTLADKKSTSPFLSIFQILVIFFPMLRESFELEVQIWF